MSRTGLLLVAVGLHWLVLCGSSPADTAQTDEARLYFESLLAKVHRRKSVSEHDQLLEELTTSALGVPVTFGDDVPIDANYRKETTAEDKYLPVVQMHGLGDFAANPLGMLPLKFAISRWLDGTYVTNIALGQSLPVRRPWKHTLREVLDGRIARVADNLLVVGGIPVVSDELSAYFLSLQKSVDEFAAIVRNDTKLRNGFNAIGYSQGNLIIRGYVQQYNKPPVANWISMHGPLLGVAGIPSCNTTTLLCQQIDEFLGYLAYDSVFQDWFTPADYYKVPGELLAILPRILENDILSFVQDVMKLLEYESSSSFLADLNNEVC
eukprot:scaffold1471_cov413-Prasinococcus_capsulatus_cf.AAC.29